MQLEASKRIGYNGCAGLLNTLQGKTCYAKRLLRGEEEEEEEKEAEEVAHRTGSSKK
jgi:IS5 family transposase